MLSLPPLSELPQHEGESLPDWRARAIHEARRRKIREARAHLVDVTFTEGPLYRAVEALTAVVQDMIERHYL